MDGELCGHGQVDFSSRIRTLRIQILVSYSNSSCTHSPSFLSLALLVWPALIVLEGLLLVLPDELVEGRFISAGPPAVGDLSVVEAELLLRVPVRLDADASLLARLLEVGAAPRALGFDLSLARRFPKSSLER